MYPHLSTDCSGITEEDVKVRQKRNTVTMGFNLSVWFLEAFAGLVIFIPYIPLIMRFSLFILVSSGMAPILYIVGMSDVRNKLQPVFADLTKRIRAYNFRKSNVVHVM